jgi:short-subunit dehydrogenase involved in D-alanine esterification of teichoic acids
MNATVARTAIVTGVSSGIGLGFTKALLERGWHDAVLYLQNATFVTGENIRVDGGVHAGG